MGKRISGSVLFIGIMAWATVVLAQEPPAPQGPVAYWKFDETTVGAAPQAANSVAGSPGGTYNGGVTQSTTVPTLSYPNQRSLSFNGTDAVVSVPQFGTFTNMSVSLWINRSGHTGSRATLVSYKEAAGGGFVLSNNEDGTNDYSRIFVHQGGWQNKENNTFTLQTGVWYHIAATYTSGALLLYRDGVDVTPAGAQPTGNMTNPSGVTGIGGRSSLNQWYFNGLIDDVRIWSRAITPAEVQILHLGCPAPSGLTATPGGNQVTLNWSAPGTGPAYAYTYNVKRGTAPGVYTQVWQGVSATTYTDTTAVAGTQYYYAVSATSAAESGNTNEVPAMPDYISVSPVTGLQTSEGGGYAGFTITLHAPVPAGESVSFTITSSKGLEGQVSGGGQAQATSISFTETAPAGGWAAGHTIPITVTGIDDPFVDPATQYSVSITASSATVAVFNGISIPDVQLINQDNDTAAITMTPTAGLVTTESAGSATFSVTLTTQPYNFIEIPIASLTPAEVTVSPAKLRFTAFGNPIYTVAAGVGTADWNVAHVVTVTGVDDNVLDFTVPFSIQTGAVSVNDSRDNVYLLTTPTVTGVNLDDEVVPTLPPVWGGGSGGGCGLLGPELLLPAALLTLRRRRQKQTV